MLLKHRPRLLGITASLRNARWGMGNQELVDSLKKIAHEQELFAFLSQESNLHLENFLEAGRREGKSFLEVYKNLKNKKGNKGLSNSETALAAALWAAHRQGVDIDHLSLSEFFITSGKTNNIAELKKKLVSADGLIISGPVYFGDRGSMAQDLIDMIRKDADLSDQMRGKVYGGIAVGAKRNGGQETTLVYQLLDIVGLGMLGVGNDSGTTAQYGGTGHAGDVGTMHKDSYGLKTAMGTGRRVADIISMLGYQRELAGPLRVLFLVLQDSNGLAMEKVKELISCNQEEILPTVVDISSKNIRRCIACDICPTDIDLDDVYRCIITSRHDDLGSLHTEIINCDAIVPVAVSVKDARSIQTNYQAFIERTRYLRRGDYVYSNALVAPLTLEEVGAKGYYSMRMATSLIRHHTVMATPMVGHIYEGKLLNNDQLMHEFRQFLLSARRLAAARLMEVEARETEKYHPVGYILSANKDIEDERLKKREAVVRHRAERLRNEAKRRLLPDKRKDTA